jgi:hypothetical protein
MASDKKAGRNKVDCKRYRDANQEARNKRLKGERHQRETARKAAKRAYKLVTGKPWGEANTTLRNVWLEKYGAPKLGPATT